MNRVSKYWPFIYREIGDLAEISSSETVEFDNLEQALNQVFSNEFVRTSDINGVRRREKMLEIQADPSKESLAFRKRRILNRYQTKPPFTVRYLQKLLDRLAGKGTTIVSVDIQNFILYVTTNIDNASLFNEVQHTVETIKPVNIIYQQNTSINDVIGLEEHISSHSVTWNYKLEGSWKLGEDPFATLDQEVVIK